VILVRATHWAAYRSGKWARLAGTTVLHGFPEGGRLCYLVMFEDGAADFWPVEDRCAGYEFAMAAAGQWPQEKSLPVP
jgi:hypothetical protein